MIIQAHHEGKCFARCCFTRRVTARMSRKDQNDLILKHQVARAARNPEYSNKMLLQTC